MVRSLLRGTVRKDLRSEVAREPTKHMTPMSYSERTTPPSWEALRPLLAECLGISEIVERYDSETDREVIRESSGVPFDPSISGT